jgi:hypothetical protein
MKPLRVDRVLDAPGGRDLRWWTRGRKLLRNADFRRPVRDYSHTSEQQPYNAPPRARNVEDGYIVTINRITGAAVLAVGAVLLTLAYRSTNAPLEQLSETMTGRYSDGIIWYFAIGIAAVVGGGLLVALGGHRVRRRRGGIRLERRL